MKITEVTYEMKRVTRQYENDTASVTVVVAEGDDPAAALDLARKTCDEALAQGRDSSLRDRLKDQMSTSGGKARLECFLRGEGR